MRAQCEHRELRWAFSGAHCVESAGQGTLQQAREAHASVTATPETAWVSGHARCITCGEVVSLTE
jgi:hypothetical protein